MPNLIRLSAKTLSLLRQTRDAFFSLLYPARCEYCATDISQSAYLCDSCRKKAKRIEEPFCRTCSEPFFGAMDEEFSCSNCAGRKFHFTFGVSRFRSRGVVREMIHRFKYGHEFHLRFPLADLLAANFDDSRIASQPFDFLVPVPLHSTRMREREFNQAGVLANLAGEKIGAPVFDCLQRIRYTTTQTQFDRDERMENLRNAFRLRESADVRGKHLVLIDDVFTTGSTVDECARMLLNAGATSVRAVTVARG